MGRTGSGSALVPRQELERALERLATFVGIEVELVFVRQRRLAIVGEEQAVDCDAQLGEGLRQLARMRQQRVAIARRNEGRRKRGGDEARHGELAQVLGLETVTVAAVSPRRGLHEVAVGTAA